MSTSFGDWHHSQEILKNFLNILSLAPLAPESLDHLNFALRKLAHFSEYAVLLSVIYWGTKRWIKVEPRHLMTWVLTFVIIFAISDEFHQSFVPGRTSQLLDVMIDSAGASVMAIATTMFEQARLKATHLQSSETNS